MDRAGLRANVMLELEALKRRIPVRERSPAQHSLLLFARYFLETQRQR